MGGVDSQLGHMDPFSFNDAAVREDLFSQLLHLLPEAGINLPHDHNDGGTDGVQQAQIPFFEGFLHDRMVRIGKSFPGDAEGCFEIHAPKAQQPDQLRDGHHRMGIVQLGGDFIGEAGIILPVMLLISAQEILHGGGNQHILLFDPELFAGPL